ncbi:MAG: hypothetical protein AAF678_03020 [Pseudomonadota bacterium]
MQRSERAGMDTEGNTKERLRGRPPLPEEKARSERVVTFLTPAERRKLELRANASGQTLSAAAHELIARGLQDN